MQQASFHYTIAVREKFLSNLHSSRLRDAQREMLMRVQ